MAGGLFSHQFIASRNDHREDEGLVRTKSNQVAIEIADGSGSRGSDFIIIYRLSKCWIGRRWQ